MMFTSAQSVPSSQLRKQPKTHDYLNGRTINEPIILPLDRPTLPSVTLSRDLHRQTIRGGDCGAGVAAHPYSITAVTSRFPERLQGQRHSALDGEKEWEIMKIVGKRRTRSGYEYNVRWKNTWLPKSELGNAQELLQDFEVRGTVQSGRERASKLPQRRANDR